jgi:LysM repeat protein
MFKFLITVLLLVVSLALNAQRISVEEYIEQFKEIAMSEMKRSGVPASITLAQGILESENGNSDLVKRSNNHFGIKCKSNWTGNSVSHDDDADGECFRAYTNAEESYRDHSDFLKNNKRYSSLFTLDPENYAAWAKGLKKAGYATNPKYPDLLIRQIERYNLQQYTLLALGNMPATDVAIMDPSLGNVPKEFKEVLSAAEPGETSYDEIRVNDTRCIYAKKGTSLLVIADKKNISLKKLLEYNDLEKDGLLEKDQYIFLHKKQKAGEAPYYIVGNGETVYDVAQKNALQLKYLLEYNNLRASAHLTANTKLSLQPGVKATVVNDPSINENGVLKSRIHLVAPKEGLFAIARTYKVTVAQLKAWNNLVSDELRIGQELIVGK